MCYFITATLPQVTDLKALRPIIDAYNLKFEPINNMFIEEQLPTDQLCLQATKHYCDCETVGYFRKTGTKSGQETPDTRKLKNKGWSDAKIARWQGEKQRSLEKIDAKGRDSTAPAEWFSFFKDLSKSGLVSEIGLLIHYYEHGVENEEFVINGRTKIDLRNLSPSFFAQMNDDHVYQFILQP